MNTLTHAVESQRCRTGESAGKTGLGAYWLAAEPIVVRRLGGDGIGENSADQTITLELRHYRSGAVEAVIHWTSWHQNDGQNDQYQEWPSLLDCSSIEDVIIALKYDTFGPCEKPVYSDGREDDLTVALSALGLPVAPPSPDDSESPC